MCIKDGGKLEHLLQNDSAVSKKEILADTFEKSQAKDTKLIETNRLEYQQATKANVEKDLRLVEAKFRCSQLSSTPESTPTTICKSEMNFDTKINEQEENKSNNTIDFTATFAVLDYDEEKERCSTSSNNGDYKTNFWLPNVLPYVLKREVALTILIPKIIISIEASAHKLRYE